MRTNTKPTGIHSNLCLLRITTALAVIWLHTCSTLADNSTLFGLTEQQCFLFSCGFRLAGWTVPVFFMLTGALLLAKQTDYPQAVFHYAKRPALALVLFGIPFAALKVIGETGTLAVSALPRIILSVVSGDGFRHMWYLYVLIGIYLVLPVLQRGLAGLNAQGRNWLLGILFVFSFVLPTLQGITGVQIAFSVPFSYPVFYLIAGSELFRRRPRWHPLWEILGILLSTAAVWASNRFGFFPEVLSGYSSPVIVLMAICVFSLFLRIPERESGTLLWQIDRLCFGAYIIHPVFIHLVYRVLKLTPVSFPWSLGAAVLFFLFFAAGSFLGTWILCKIPFLRKHVL